MKVVVTGAAGQLGHGHRRSAYAGRADVLPVTRADARHRRRARRSRRSSRASGPTPSSTAPPINDVDGAEDRRGRRAPRQRPRGARAGARRRRRGRDRSSTTAPTSSSTASAIVPYTEEDEPAPQSVYASSKLLGEWFAADCAAPLRAARREPVRRLAAPQQRRPHRRRDPRRRAGARLRRSHRDAELRRDVADATWQLIDDAAPRPASTTASTAA